MLVFSLFPLLFCVPRLVSRLSSCHLISIVISFPFPFHLHRHLICRSLKRPRCCGACVCVSTIWRDVKLLSFAGGTWALGWHGPTKTHPSFCANVPAIFESWWGVVNPKTIMPFFNENRIRIFEFSTWTDEGDFSFPFLHSWRNLRLRWISCPFQFSADISEFLLASIDFIPFFKAATKEFSFQSTPNTLLFLSGVTGLFLHVRCAPQQNSQWQFWASFVFVRVYTVHSTFWRGSCLLLPTWHEIHLMMEYTFECSHSCLQIIRSSRIQDSDRGTWIKFEAPRNQNRCFQAPRNYSWIILNFEK